jgi:hypothetical protein
MYGGQYDSMRPYLILSLDTRSGEKEFSMTQNQHDELAHVIQISSL